MEKLLNDMIIACENCVSKSVCCNKQMNECIRICHIQEVLCKNLKVAQKYKAGTKTIKCLKEACLNNLIKCNEICSKHKEKHCVTCAKHSAILIEELSK